MGHEKDFSGRWCCLPPGWLNILYWVTSTENRSLRMWQNVFSILARPVPPILLSAAEGQRPNNHLSCCCSRFNWNGHSQNQSYKTRDLKAICRPRVYFLIKIASISHFFGYVQASVQTGFVNFFILEKSGFLKKCLKLEQLWPSLSLFSSNNCPKVSNGWIQT